MGKQYLLSQSFDPEDCYMLVVLFVVIDLAGSVVVFCCEFVGPGGGTDSFIWRSGT